MVLDSGTSTVIGLGKTLFVPSTANPAEMSDT